MLSDLTQGRNNVSKHTAMTPQRQDIDELSMQLLVLLEDNDRNGTDSANAALALNMSGQRVGSVLRDLRIRGLVYKVPVSLGSFRVRWHITEDGRAYLLSSVESETHNT